MSAISQTLFCPAKLCFLAPILQKRMMGNYDQLPYDSPTQSVGAHLPMSKWSLQVSLARMLLVGSAIELSLSLARNVYLQAGLSKLAAGANSLYRFGAGHDTLIGGRPPRLNLMEFYLLSSVSFCVSFCCRMKSSSGLVHSSCRHSFNHKGHTGPCTDETLEHHPPSLFESTGKQQSSSSSLLLQLRASGTFGMR